MRALLFFIFLLSSICGRSQKYSLEKSSIVFYSSAVIEDIRAENTSSKSLFNSNTGEIVFSVPIADFEFEKALMEEHFNEKYLESDKFPKALFQGRLVGYDLAQAGEQKVKAVGKITIHGVSRELEVDGVFKSIDNTIVVSARFMLHVADFKIKIPQLLWQNIAEDIEVTVEFNYKRL